MPEVEQQLAECQRKVANLQKYKSLFFSVQRELEELKLSASLKEDAAPTDDGFDLLLDNDDFDNDLELNIDSEELSLENPSEETDSDEEGAQIALDVEQAPRIIKNRDESQQLLDENLETYRRLFFSMRDRLAQERIETSVKIQHLYAIAEKKSFLIDEAEAEIDKILSHDDALAGVLQPIVGILGDLGSITANSNEHLKQLNKRMTAVIEQCDRLGIKTGDDIDLQRHILDLESKLASLEKAEALHNQRKNQFELLHVIDTVRVIQLREDASSLLQAVLELCDNGNLKASGTIKIGDKSVHLSERGGVRKKEISLIEKHKREGELVYLDSKVLINSEHLSVLLTSPDGAIDEKSVLGLIRGMVAVVNWRISASKTSEIGGGNEALAKIMHLSEQLITSVSSQLDSLGEVSLRAMDGLIGDMPQILDQQNIPLDTQTEILEKLENARSAMANNIEKHGHLDPRFVQIFSKK